jgi:peptidoglycan hydrolase CwlO-like protein
MKTLRQAGSRLCTEAAAAAGMALLAAAGVILLAATGVALLTAAAPAAMTPAALAAPKVQVLDFGKKPTTLPGLRAQARVMQTQMHRLGDEMAVIERRYEEADARLVRVDGELSQIRLQLGAASASLARQQDLLGRRLAAMYKMGDYSWVDFLTDAGAFADPQTQLDFFGLVARQDRQAQDEVRRLTTAVAGFESALDQRRQDTLDAQADIAAERALMGQRIAERRALLRDLVKKIQKIVAAQAPPLGSFPPAKGPYTQITWAQALLVRLGAPATTQNLVAVTAWEMAEGGHWYNTASYNPLNTTMPEPGATSMNSVGVKAYVSWQQGFVATIATLRNGRYGPILAALARGHDAQAVVDAVAASPWGTHSISLTSSPLSLSR